MKSASWTNALPRPVSPYGVQQPGHWVFEATGLAQGDGFGADYVGYETDAADFRTGSAGTVFNAGTTDWAYGLQPELDGQTPTVIGQITRNVLRQLSAPRAETAEVRQWHTDATDALWHCYDTIGAEQPTGMVLAGAGYRGLPAAVSGAVPVYRYRGTAVGAAGTRYALSRSSSIGNANWSRTGMAFCACATARAAPP